CEVKAPHYIVITSNKGEDYLENIGFFAENILLKMTSLGLGTCWLKCNLKRDDILEFIDLDNIDEDDEEYENRIESPYAIIAFGYPEKKELLFRSPQSDPDRKRLNKICKKMDRKWIKVLNTVRLSPSIKNIQPWMFYSKEYGFDLYREKEKKSIESDCRISMGVALKHFDIACSNFDINVNFEKVEVKKKMGKEYFISVTCNE
ncbi:MAG: nitroreductase family protein, partial [Peptostreptococcaceae bacterium]